MTAVCVSHVGHLNRSFDVNRVVAMSCSQVKIFDIPFSGCHDELTVDSIDSRSKAILLLFAGISHLLIS